MKKTIIFLSYILTILCLTSCESILPLRTNPNMRSEMEENAKVEHFHNITTIDKTKTETKNDLCLKWGHTPVMISGTTLIDYQTSQTQHWKICQDCKELYDYEDHYVSDTFLTLTPSGIIFNGASYLRSQERCACGFRMGYSMKYLTGGDAE